jgi:hypothetical protein
VGRARAAADSFARLGSLGGIRCALTPGPTQGQNPPEDRPEIEKGPAERDVQATLLQDADVASLAAVGSNDRLDAFGPAPTRLESRRQTRNPASLDRPIPSLLSECRRRGRGPAHVVRLERPRDKCLVRLSDPLEDEEVARPAAVISEVHVDAHPDELPALGGEATEMVVKESRVEPGIHTREVPDIDCMFDRSHRSAALHDSYIGWARGVPG